MAEQARPNGRRWKWGEFDLPQGAGQGARMCDLNLCGIMACSTIKVACPSLESPPETTRQ